MKIAINTLSIIPGRVGGTETFLINLVKNLLKLDKLNKYLCIVSSKNKEIFDFNFQNVEFLEFDFDNNSRAKRVFIEQFVLPNRLRKEKVDLFIAPGNTGLIRCFCRQLLIVHDLIYFVYPEYYSLIKRIYLQNLVKYSCKRADRIVTMSQNTKRDIIKYTGVNEDKIDIIYEGVDFERFSKVKEDEAQELVRDQYGIGAYIYSPTSLYPHKNNDLLIKIFAKLKREKKILQKLVITGIDPCQQENRLKRMISKEGMENEIFYLGRVPGEYLPCLYKGADITIYLSSYEGFGLPILEAMASGCPILSSNRSSLPEVTGDAGILVNPFDINEVVDKLYRLLIDRSLRGECIADGLVRAKQFSWENVAQRLIGVYSNL